MILVSKCCIGSRCRYNNGGIIKKKVVTLLQKNNIVTICPECDGGLPTPREGCSIVDGLAIGRKTGTDYTDAYQRGAMKALSLCQKNNITKAYLLKNSPSCGKGYGITAILLEEHGISVIAL